MREVHHDLSDLESKILIWIIPKVHSLILSIMQILFFHLWFVMFKISREFRFKW